VVADTLITMSESLCNSRRDRVVFPAPEGEEQHQHQPRLWMASLMAVISSFWSRGQGASTPNR